MSYKELASYMYSERSVGVRPFVRGKYGPARWIDRENGARRWCKRPNY